MRLKHHRWLVCLCSSAVALVAGWLVLAARNAHHGPLVGYFEGSAEPPTPSAAAPARTNWLDPARPEEWKWFVSEADAGRLFAIGPQFGTRYDPWTHFVREPAQTTRIDWPERTEGELRWTTNSLGLRESHELSDPPAALRVLVAGDSHAFGYCANDESFANRLEALLAASHRPQTVEVLNAAVPVFSLIEYEGTLHKFRSFAPQVFVVAVYAGNDFAELGVLRPWFTGQLERRLTPDEFEMRRRARKTALEATAQCFNSIARFRAHPEQRAELVGMAVELCQEMQGICRQRGTAMIVLLLPAACDCAWKEPQPDIERARAALATTAEDERINSELCDTFLLGLAGAQIESIDMRPIFLAQPEPPYWRTDLHLNPTGHRLVAEQLLPAVEARLR